MTDADVAIVLWVASKTAGGFFKHGVNNKTNKL